MTQRIAALILALALVTCSPAPVAAQAPVLLAQWGSLGSAPGQMTSPYGIALDGSGNVYVSEWGNSRVQVFTNDGTYLRSWGSAGAAAGQFLHPQALAVDASGNVYVADTGNSRIEVFAEDGAFLRQWGGYGSGPAQLAYPTGIAVDANGEVFVSDNGNGRVQVFASNGTLLRQWATPSLPRDVELDGQGNIMVAMGYECGECFGMGIQVYTTAGAPVRSFSDHGWIGVAVDRDGNTYVTANEVDVFSPTGAFLFRWGQHGSPITLDYAIGVVVDPSGAVYVADNFHNRILKFGTPPTPTHTATWGSLKSRYR